MRSDIASKQKPSRCELLGFLFVERKPSVRRGVP